MTDEILDAPITAKEIHDQISKLKNKTASGTDTILNEIDDQTWAVLSHAFSRKNIQRHH